jgi:hypothetical protein
VCGTSILLGPQGSSKVYKREATFAEASDLCNELGARLCTVDEIRHNEANPSTCAYDSIFAWTWVDSDHTGWCMPEPKAIDWGSWRTGCMVFLLCGIMGRVP